MTNENVLASERPSKFGDLTTFMLKMLPGAHWKLPGAFLLGLLEMGALLSMPLVTAQIINALVAHDWNNFRRFLMLLGLQLGAQMLFSGLHQYAFLRIDESVGNSLRRTVVENVLRRKLEFFERFPAGDIISRTINDTMMLKNYLTNVFLQIIYDGLTLVIVLAILLMLNPTLALLTAAVSPLILVFSRLSERRIEDASMRVRISIGSLMESLQSWLSRPFQLKIYSLEPAASKRLAARNDDLTNTSIKLGVLSAIVGVINTTILSVPNLLIFGYGGYLTLSGQLNVGQLFAFVTFAAYFQAPLQRLSNIKVMALPSLYPVQQRLRELLGAESLDFAEQSRPSVLVKSLAVKDLKFSFGHDGYSLSVPDLVANRGEIVGIAGANGSGKSTVARLLAGLYEAHAGETKFQGDNGEELFSKERRKLFGFLPQDAALFDGTLHENICLFDGKADSATLSKLADELGFGEWIGSLPNAWDTEINANLAVTLSGGQMQKIGLARLLYNKRPILILDEPTNDLDEATRARLEKILKEARANHLIIVISHSGEMLSLCDRVYNLKPAREGSNEIVCVCAEPQSSPAFV